MKISVSNFKLTFRWVSIGSISWYGTWQKFDCVISRIICNSVIWYKTPLLFRVVESLIGSDKVQSEGQVLVVHRRNLGLRSTRNSLSWLNWKKEWKINPDWFWGQAFHHWLADWFQKLVYWNQTLDLFKNSPKYLNMTIYKRKAEKATSTNSFLYEIKNPGRKWC